MRKRKQKNKNNIQKEALLRAIMQKKGIEIKKIKVDEECKTPVLGFACYLIAGFLLYFFL